MNIHAGAQISSNIFLLRSIHNLLNQEIFAFWMFTMKKVCRNEYFNSTCHLYCIC